MPAQQPQRSGQSATTHKTYKHCNYNPQITSADIYTGLLADGFLYPARAEHIQGGQSIRMPAMGKGPSNSSASVKLSDDGKGLHWHDWPSGAPGTLFSRQPPLHDPAEVARRFREAEHCKRQQDAGRDEQHQRTATLARQIWANGYASGDYPYSDLKRLTGMSNALLDAVTGELLIPMWVSGIGIVNLQRINDNGIKRFLKGGRIKGSYSVIGSLDNAQRVCVSTGWATGAGLYFPHFCKCCLCSEHNDVAVCARRRRHG